MTALTNKKLRRSLFRQPLLNVVQNHLISYPTPSNLTRNWNWGVLARMCLVLQIATRIFLAMNYTAHVDLSFNIVQHIMRDVPNRWLLRYLHANRASLFFIVVYLHIFRGLYYTSYAQPRELVWLLRIVILLLMVITAFLGYILPWRQMSLWGDYAPQMEVFKHINAFYIYLTEGGGKISSFKRIGPHNYDVCCLIFGTLLGDSSAQMRSRATRICFQQENSNVAYLRWLHDYFASRGYCNTELPKLLNRIGDNGEIRYFSKFKTYSFQSFNWFHDIFYENKVKKVPSMEFLDMYLSPLALAVWIMDDRTRSGSGLTLSTHSFTYEDVEKLKLFLGQKYNIKSEVNKSGYEGQFVLYIWAESMPLVTELVRPYLSNSRIMRKLRKYA